MASLTACMLSATFSSDIQVAGQVGGGKGGDDGVCRIDGVEQEHQDEARPAAGSAPPNPAMVGWTSFHHR